jgi:hypothetical protein
MWPFKSKKVVEAKPEPKKPEPVTYRIVMTNGLTVMYHGMSDGYTDTYGGYLKFTDRNNGIEFMAAPGQWSYVKYIEEKNEQTVEV